MKKPVKHNEEKFRTLLDSVPDSLVFVDRHGKIVIVNEQTEKLFGYSRVDMIGKDVEILMPERFRKNHKNLIEKFFLNPAPRVLGVGLDLYGISRSGTEFPIDISLSPIKTDDGILVVADIREISERKQAEEKIRRGYHYQSTISSILQISLEPVSLEKQLELILDTILAIPWLTPLSMGSIYLVEDNPRVLVMKAQRGLPEKIRRACSEVPFGDCLCGLGASTRKIMFSDCIDEHHDTQYVCEFPHGHFCVPILGGKKTLGVLNLYIKDGHEQNLEEEDLLSAVAKTIAGIIEHKRTEIEKERLQEQLIQSEKLPALGRVTANVAHDIRNPLTIIGGYVRRLIKSIPDGAKEKEYAEVVITEVSRLEKILGNVLKYLKRTSLDKEEYDINIIANEFLKTYKHICREQSIEIKKSFPDLPKILIDKDQTAEAINNLISNAVEAMPNGGILTIATGEEEFRENTYVTFKITDTGEGIVEEKLKMIYEPFYSTKVAGHGAGMGLSICKKIIEDHGGFITVESIVGKGSTFVLYFPLN